jgi:hypothetical protein
MSKYRFRGALAAAQFPLALELAGRTVNNGRTDLDVKAPQTVLGQPSPSQFDTPQVLFAQNVVPTSEGMQSVGFLQKIRPLAGADDFDQAITLRDEDENNFLFVPARGKNYIWNAATGDWESTTPFTGWTGRLVTRAYVNGRTFICYEGQGIYEYDFVAGTFTLQAVTGLTNAEIRGIGGSSNYLIAFTDLEVCWSSLVNPLDFAPSMATGAGRSIPQDVKARITAVLGISGGFIIYTAKNAIAAVYTNNTRAPFTFKEIANAGGIQTYEQVTSEQTSGAQYAWTTGGLQKITVQNAEPVAAEINDFIAGKMWDEFDPVTKVIETFYSDSAEFPVKLSFISSRFLMISYSVSSDSSVYQYCIVYDIVLRRYGRVKMDHTDCFSYPYPNVAGVVTYDDLANTTYDDLSQTTYADLDTGVISDPPSKLTVAFLGVDGEVKLMLMDYNKEAEEKGVLIFGKFQVDRALIITMQELNLEGIYQPVSDRPHPFTVTAYAELPDNKGTVFSAMKLQSAKGKNARYARRLTGLNVNAIIEGTFALKTYLLEVTAEGDR